MYKVMLIMITLMMLLILVHEKDHSRCFFSLTVCLAKFGLEKVSGSQHGKGYKFDFKQEAFNIA